MLRLCSHHLLLEVTGCKFAMEQRWTVLCDITLHAVWVCLDGEKRRTNAPDFLSHIKKKKKSLWREVTLTPAVCRSFYSRWLLKCPPPQPGWGTRRCSSTSCGRTRSQTPRPAWGTAAHPPDTSRRTWPGSRSGGCRRWWSTPADRKTHTEVTHKHKRFLKKLN